MSRTLVTVVAALIGLSASVAMYYGLVYAVPLVNWGDDETELLRIEGAHDVRFASLFAALAGVLLLTLRAWWTGGTAVAAAVLLAALAHENTIASWGLLLVYVVALLKGCAAARAAGRRRSPRGAGADRVCG